MALSITPKLLLTATPLQNSLMELYGLVSVIDEHHFGDAKSFRAQYSRLADGGRFEDLKARLAPVCHRTVRRQVLEYVFSVDGCFGSIGVAFAQSTPTIDPT